MGRIAKILGLVAIVALLLGGGALFPVAAQGEAVVSIDAPAEATAGSDFTANVSISDVTDFDACQYDVTFDATVLRLDDVTSGLIGSTTVPVDLYNELSAGNYRIIQNVSGLDGVTGSGYLAVLHFHVIGSEGDVSAIDLSNGVLSDITASAIAATWVGDTVSVSDFTAPTVASTSPLDDATGVLVDTVITATFSEAMDDSTITTGSFTLRRGAISVSGSVSYNSGSYTATFTPAADLAYGTTYTASLSTAITDAAGNPLAAASSWGFTTGSEPGVVTVSINAPAGVDPDSDFTANVSISSVTDFDACQYDVTFDATVLRLDDVTSGLIGSTTVPVDLYNELSAGTYRVIQNVSGLDGATGSGYLAVLHLHVIGSEGESSIIDLFGGVLSDITASSIPATWVGDTVSVADSTPPTVASTSPTSSATGVAVTTTVTATFSEAMDELTITTSSFTLRRGATSVSGSVSYNAGTYTATFTPAADLAYNTTYTAILSTAITDLAGNHLASIYSWNFSTSTAPAPGVVTVGIDAPFVVAPDSDFTANVNIFQVTDFDACQYDVTFDPLVLRLDSVTSGLIGSTTVPVDLYNELSAGNWRVIQNVPGLTGADGSGYLAVLHFHVIGSEGDVSAIDLSNGVLSDITASQIEAVWTGDTVTVADTVAPTVVSTSPAADATDVPVGTVVTVTFSEAMDELTITAGSFSIADVVGSVSYNAGIYTATFTPAIGLGYETTYTATLTTAITDTAGNPLSSTYTWSFTTEPVTPGTVLVSIDAPAGPRAGSDFTANVDISSVTDFDACQYDVSFDATVLRLDDVTAGEIGSTEIPVDIYNELTAGTFRVVQNVPGLTGATGSGYLAVLHFHVLGAEDDVSIIDLSNGTLSDIQAQPITAVWVGDSVTITRQPSGGGGGGGGGGGADTTPPIISSVGASNVTKTSADVAWTTDEESNSQVEYWASPGVVTPLDTVMVTEHTIHLDELTPGSNYYFKVRSTDEADNMAESEEHTFTTLPEAAAFTTGQLSVSPSAVYVGEAVAISVLVTNNGDAAGNYAVVLKIDGVVEETREIALDAGASEEVTFTTVKNMAGSYSVEVGGLSGSFTVEEKPEETTTPPEIPVEPTTNWTIIWGAMAGVLIVGVIILWLAIRRRAY